ncbi:MAG: MotA/TolQ/ExbB proton channel family protein [Candidatus Omnitrophica bacterium]|nr:MotA/TolQ/ExbB proton channel family protein [Candidatus Omnitrophota bacterium]MDD5436908.1 MotA/TolQ/ExbB proton channel family protein [Candidatus Omnitrophota bacterium]
MFWIIAKGGPVMIPIILASILGLAIIIDKLWMLVRIRIDAQKFTNDLVMEVREGDFDKAIDMCIKNARSPLAVTLRSGLEKRGLELHEIEKALERTGNNQVKNLEKGIGGLISIIGIEPLMGFLGTITGLIKAFMAWEKAGSNITVSALAAGIYEAMITTAAGLIIAVPFYLVCNFIISRIKYISYEMSDSSMQLVEAFARQRAKR